MDGVECVPVPTEVRGEHETTNAYLLGGAGGVLVDPAASTAALDEVVEHHDPAHVVVTHTHPDHVGGISEYAAGRTVWIHRGFEGQFERATGIEPDRTLGEGTTIDAGDVTAEVIETPGHAPDHVAFQVDTPERDETGPAILAGDLIVAAGSVVIGAAEGDMRAYLTSLRRLRAREPAVVYPGHGPIIRDPLAEIERLIDHRLERERRVLDAVRAGGRTPTEIVDTAYDRDLTGVRDFARSTVIAHLRKLDEDGELDWDGRQATVE